MSDVIDYLSTENIQSYTEQLHDPKSKFTGKSPAVVYFYEWFEQGEGEEISGHPCAPGQVACLMDVSQEEQEAFGIDADQVVVSVCSQGFVSLFDNDGMKRL